MLPLVGKVACRPTLVEMNEELRFILSQMDPLLDKLKACPPETFPTRKKLPDSGIYVFYEDKRPIYVGRSNQIHKRIQIHGTESAPPGKASFAFRLLAKKCNFEIGNRTGTDRSQKAKEHAGEFRKQKQRVRRMQVRAVAVSDVTESYFFEAYAILALGTTKFNKFEPH